jgi:hypothetical protein
MNLYEHSISFLGKKAVYSNINIARSLRPRQQSGRKQLKPGPGLHEGHLYAGAKISRGLIRARLILARINGPIIKVFVITVGILHR